MCHNILNDPSQHNFLQQPQQQQAQQTQQQQYQHQQQVHRQQGYNQPMQRSQFAGYGANHQGTLFAPPPCQQDPFSPAHQANMQINQPYPAYRSGYDVAPAQIQPNYSPPNILEQIRAYVGGPSPIFILPTNPIPIVQTAQGQQANCPGARPCDAPAPPPYYYPPSCIPVPYPMPIVNPFGYPNSVSTTEKDCECCPRKSSKPAKFGSYSSDSQEHRCQQTNDDTICAKKNCPSSISLQALASQLLSIQSVISCAATRLVLRKVPGSNITNTMDETVERAMKTLEVLTQEQLLAEARNAQQVNALINLHMMANPPQNIVPILTTIQLKVNLLKSQVEAAINRRLTENQGVGAEASGCLDAMSLALKSNEELRTLLATLRQKECDERVSYNFAPYHSQRAIAECRLRNVESKILQVEREMERRRCAQVAIAPKYQDPCLGGGVWHAYPGTISSGPFGKVTAPQAQNYPSPDPFQINPQSPRRLNLQPSSPESTYNPVATTSAAQQPMILEKETPAYLAAQQDMRDYDNEVSKPTDPCEGECQCRCNCQSSDDDESDDAQEAKKKLQLVNEANLVDSLDLDETQQGDLSREEVSEDEAASEIIFHQQMHRLVKVEKKSISTDSNDLYGSFEDKEIDVRETRDFKSPYEEDYKLFGEELPIIIPKDVDGDEKIKTEEKISHTDLTFSPRDSWASKEKLTAIIDPTSSEHDKFSEESEDLKKSRRMQELKMNLRAVAAASLINHIGGEQIKTEGEEMENSKKPEEKLLELKIESSESAASSLIDTKYKEKIKTREKETDDLRKPEKKLLELNLEPSEPATSSLVDLKNKEKIKLRGKDTENLKKLGKNYSERKNKLTPQLSIDTKNKEIIKTEGKETEDLKKSHLESKISTEKKIKTESKEMEDLTKQEIKHLESKIIPSDSTASSPIDEEKIKNEDEKFEDLKKREKQHLESKIIPHESPASSLIDSKNKEKPKIERKGIKDLKEREKKHLELIMAESGSITSSLIDPKSKKGIKLREAEPKNMIKQEEHDLKLKIKSNESITTSSIDTKAKEKIKLGGRESEDWENKQEKKDFKLKIKSSESPASSSFVATPSSRKSDDSTNSKIIKSHYTKYHVKDYKDDSKPPKEHLLNDSSDPNAVKLFPTADRVARGSDKNVKLSKIVQPTDFRRKLGKSRLEESKIATPSSILDSNSPDGKSTKIRNSQIQSRKDSKEHERASSSSEPSAITSMTRADIPDTGIKTKNFGKLEKNISQSPEEKSLASVDLPAIASQPDIERLAENLVESDKSLHTILHAREHTESPERKSLSSRASIEDDTGDIEKIRDENERQMLHDFSKLEKTRDKSEKLPGDETTIDSIDLNEIKSKLEEWPLSPQDLTVASIDSNMLEDGSQKLEEKENQDAINQTDFSNEPPMCLELREEMERDFTMLHSKMDKEESKMDTEDELADEKIIDLHNSPPREKAQRLKNRTCKFVPCKVCSKSPERCDGKTNDIQMVGKKYSGGTAVANGEHVSGSDGVGCMEKCIGNISLRGPLEYDEDVSDKVENMEQRVEQKALELQALDDGSRATLQTSNVDHHDWTTSAEIEDNQLLETGNKTSEEKISLDLPATTSSQSNSNTSEEETILGGQSVMGNHVESFASIIDKLAALQFQLMADVPEALRENDSQSTFSQADKTPVKWKYMAITKLNGEKKKSNISLNEIKSSKEHLISLKNDEKASPPIKRVIVQDKTNKKTYVLTRTPSRDERNKLSEASSVAQRTLLIRSRLKNPQSTLEKQSMPFSAVTLPKCRQNSIVPLSDPSTSSQSNQRNPLLPLKSSEEFLQTPSTENYDQIEINAGTTDSNTVSEKERSMSV